MKEKLELVKLKAEIMILKVRQGSVLQPHDIQKEISEMIGLLNEISQDARQFDPNDR